MPAEQDETTTPTVVGALRSAISSIVSDVRVCLPARIVTYDAASQKATVQITVRETYVDEEGEIATEPGPIINEVPVQFPGAGPYRITWPIAAGDLVTLIFASSSIDRFMALGGSDVDPEDQRHHTLDDAIAFPGLHTFASVPTTAPTDAMVLHADKVKLGGPSGTEPTIKASTWQSGFADVIDAIAAAITGVAGAGASVTTAWTAFTGTSYKTTNTEVK